MCDNPAVTTTGNYIYAVRLREQPVPGKWRAAHLGARLTIGAARTAVDVPVDSSQTISIPSAANAPVQSVLERWKGPLAAAAVSHWACGRCAGPGVRGVARARECRGQCRV
jgi:hypothetical protein